MRELVPELEEWLAQGRRFALATVTAAWGSSPRPVGSTMAIRDDGLCIGSVSGGCVETAVREAALEVLGGANPRLMEFTSGEGVWEVGLSCGGRIHVWIELGWPFRQDERDRVICAALIKLLQDGQRTLFVCSLDPENPMLALYVPGGTCITNSSDLEPQIVETALQRYNGGQSGEVEIGGVPCFVRLFPSPERLIIVGAVHIAEPLVTFASVLGFETVVIDPRESPVTGLNPDLFIRKWPAEALMDLNLNANDLCVTLTHDPKIDDPALVAFLSSPARYVGALGSRKSHAERLERLAASGFSESDLSRIHGPIGLDIGARTAPEIALSIVAEIVKVRRMA